MLHLTPFKLWLIALTLTVFNGALVYFYFNQPTVLGIHAESWDFRIQELRELDQPNVTVTPTPTATFGDLLLTKPSPTITIKDRFGKVL